jgi:hypothetical protein
MNNDDLMVEYLKIVSGLTMNALDADLLKNLSPIFDALDKKEKIGKLKNMIDYCLDVKEDT